MPANPAFRARRSVNFARRQMYRRLMRAAMAAAGSAAVAMLGLLAAGAGAMTLGRLLLCGAVALGMYARRWLVLAGRSRVGARSEDEVQRALAGLEGEGWRLRHSLPWRGRGDIDSVAIAPTGVAFAIESKTRTFDVRHVAGVREMALWLHRRRRRWCRRGAFPVLCVVRASGLERVDGGVLIVSLDRLVPALRVAAGLSKRPAFLVGM
jgi:Nuclease-related domain